MPKMQLPSVGGIRKVLKTNDNSSALTTISQALAALQQAVFALQHPNTGNGTIGNGSEASLVLGPGLTGGGVLLGAVSVRLTAPIPALLAEDGADGDPGPPGKTGAAGANGSTGAQGPIGPAAFMAADDGQDGDIGPPGQRGATGANGANGTAGAPGVAAWSVVDETWTDEELFKGMPSSTGAFNINGQCIITGGSSQPLKLVGADGSQIFSVDSPTASTGVFFSFRNGGVERGFFGNGSNTFAGANVADFTIGCDTGVLRLNVGTSNALKIDTNKAATFASSISILGATPGVNAGQTDLGNTTTNTIISTAGGVVMTGFVPSTIWKVNVNGVAYAIPLYAL
jgi:hypothetical protein